MELPQELKELYRHWEGHTSSHATQIAPEDIFTGAISYKDIEAFITERMSIWEKHYVQQAPPYTTDPILQKYRFCNMLRELDRQTIAFHTLLNPLRNDFPRWLLNMFYCRMVARPETIEKVGLLSFDKQKNQELYKRLMEHPRPRYGTPYVFPVSVILKSEWPTREKFITQYLPQVIEEIASEIETWEKISVSEGLEKLLPKFTFNLYFLWTEVLIDVAYQFPEHLDLYKEFPIGPGSAPTFKKINDTIPPQELAVQLGALQTPSGVTYNQKPILLSAENWEGVGCEYRKYTNLQKGEGRKRIYTKN